MVERRAKKKYFDSLIYGDHLISIADLDKQKILQIILVASLLQDKISRGQKLDILDNVILATLFFEPSTRTRLSFESAIHKMGGKLISTADGSSSSSAVKGERIADTIRTVSGYADIIVQRHPDVGSAKEAAKYASVPVINAGDGSGEHPTQALLDLYTILKERGTLDGLKVVLVGDLKHGRTTHSLMQALSLWDVEMVLVSPPELAAPKELVGKLLQKGIKITQTQNLEQAAAQAHILYVTRLQKERFSDMKEYERLKGEYVVDGKFMNAHPGITLLHPLPRVDEIASEVDSHKDAAYFRQAQNGLYVRAAILALTLRQHLVV